MFKKFMQGFAKNENGNAAVVFGFSMIPVVMIGTMAVDFGNGERIRTALQHATDAAVLAAASSLASGGDDNAKKAIAEKTFYANLDANLVSSFSVVPHTYINFPNRQIFMKVDVETKDMMTSLMTDKMALSVDATAQVDNGTPICMMSLNPTAKEAISINGTADVEARGCAVQVNSSDPEALRQVGTGKATADHFCVNGNYDGSALYPKPETGCLVEKDPLAGKMATAWSSVSTACTVTGKTMINSAGTTTLAPGVYCNDVEIKKGTVVLTPGARYVFKDSELSISSGATLNAQDQTILLTGSNTRINVQGGASLDLSAPASGPFSGIALAQHESSTNPHNKYNTITGGGYIRINGIVYYPSQKLSIRGNGIIGQTTDQFAVIADQIEVQGTGKLTINISANYQAAGLPELPESKERIRLVN